MNTFDLRIIAADRTLYEGPAVSVNIPVCDGSMGILAGHMGLITAIKAGMLSYRTGEKDVVRKVAVSDGLFRFEANEAIVLVDTAEDAAEIDLQRAEEAERRAREALLKKQNLREQTLLRADLNRALGRIKTKKHN